MKTSNILITTAVLMVVMALITYNLGLKAEYKKAQELGTVRYDKANRFSDYNRAKVKSFNTLKINCANVINTQIEYGEEEAVWIKKSTEDQVDVTQNGNVLDINLSEKGKNSKYLDAYILIISPKIKMISTTTFDFGVGTRGFAGTLKTLIYGFSQDSLALNIDPRTSVELQKNRLNYLYASVGDSTGDGNLVVRSENYIDALNLQVLGKSSVELLDLDIKSIKSKISDGAIVTFRGATLSKLNKK